MWNLKILQEIDKEFKERVETRIVNDETAKQKSTKENAKDATGYMKEKKFKNHLIAEEIVEKMEQRRKV
ncbi:hypothetical protein CHS0354_023357 [Potamilus streckersoni]|uniref:Uncharacterized protein n=1 Tax=Potamilus streckersoni TaxID=2493646 RepID=A0AAE0T5U2_9BIVA|nr:hypothetical protein CHS0354_023357 [Potamilus streckersoni]